MRALGVGTAALATALAAVALIAHLATRPPATGPTPDWWTLYSELRDDGKCAEAAEFRHEIQAEGNIYASAEEIADLEAQCGDTVLLPWGAGERVGFDVKGNGLGLQKAWYWFVCWRGGGPEAPDPEAVQRAIDRAQDRLDEKAADAPTAWEKRRFRCSHRALRQAFAAENRSGNADVASKAGGWLLEALRQGAPAAEFEFHIRRIDGTWPPVPQPQEALAVEVARSRDAVIGAAFWDYPPAYLPAAEIILDRPENPYGDPGLSRFLDQETISRDAVCFLRRAEMFFQSEPESPRWKDTLAKVRGRLETARERLPAPRFAVGISAAEAGQPACATPGQDTLPWYKQDVMTHRKPALEDRWARQLGRHVD